MQILDWAAGHELRLEVVPIRETSRPGSSGHARKVDAADSAGRVAPAQLVAEMDAVTDDIATRSSAVAATSSSGDVQHPDKVPSR